MRPAADGGRGSPPEGRHLARAPFGVELRTAGDQFGEDRDGLGVAKRGEALDPERVEVVAGEQGQVFVLSRKQARLPVVEEISLTDGLDDERVLGGGCRGAGTGRGKQAEVRFLPRLHDMGRDRRLALAQERSENPQRVGRLNHSQKPPVETQIQ